MYSNLPPKQDAKCNSAFSASGRSGHGVGLRSECRRATEMGTGNENGNLRVTPKLFATFFCNMSVLSILLGVAGSNQWNLFGSIWVCSNMLNFVDGMK